MPFPIRTIALFVVLLASTAVGQRAEIHELLVKPDAAGVGSVIARNAAEVQRSESRAKPDKLGIFTFDSKLLEAKGAVFTVTLFDDLPITVTSFGIHREPDYAFVVGTWTGEFKGADGESVFPLELGITTWVVDEDGSYGFPSPYQTTVDKESSPSYTTRLAGTVPDKKVVYSVNGRIYVPYRKTLYFVSPLQNNPDFSIIYEPDPSMLPERSSLE